MGGGLADLVISPGNVDDLVVAGEAGVFRSVDGGKSWCGLNDGLPNLPVRRLLDLPVGYQGVRLGLRNDAAVAWPPGDKLAWLPGDNADLVKQSQLREALSESRGITVTTVSSVGDFIYSGMQNGEIRVACRRMAG